MNISIYQCPRHRTFYAIAFDEEDRGERITSSKCCGEWRTLRSWPVDARMIGQLKAQIEAFEASRPLVTQEPD